MTFVRLLVPARYALVCLFALLGPTNAWAAGVVQTLGEAESEKVKKCINQFGQPVPCPPEDITPGNCALPAGCNTQDPTTYGICTSGVMTFCRCANMPDMKVVVADDGRASCVPTKACRSHSAGAPNSLGMNDQTCRRFPISPKNSIDPNDKVGTLGAADPGFVPGTTPLNYAVHFENLSTATAPAQVVVVTDQLDALKFDLDTFQFGPISFGNLVLVPGPGPQAYTGGVDFRPAQNLIVTIAAELDKISGLVTWRFTSIDPDTGELTDDPDAGFLPPNTTPPAGEGSVVFTVSQKSGLATGTVIQNHATVVFDQNVPIQTPTWHNTVDRDAPVTHVLPLAPTQTSPTFTVQWSGTDIGSGIGGYTVLVSDNGGPFNVWLEGAAMSAAYPGQAGHTYSFFSVGQDLAGNVEGLKTAAEATTRVGTAPACATDVSAKLQVTRSGFGYNLATGRFVQTVTLKNTSTGIITGPISLVLDSLTTNATLFNLSGSTACALPAGSPYINFTGNLNPGASVSITLQFANPTRAGISYATRVLAGSAAR